MESPVLGWFFKSLKIQPKTKLTKTKLRERSPQANYTDRATAACRRSFSANVFGYRVLRGQRNEFPWSLISVF
jgi:hypothetical protein